VPASDGSIANVSGETAGAIDPTRAYTRNR
jgi:hypothetical protein